MPSKAESFGMMAIEAMACEKPVVVFDNTALPDVTFAPECGYLVKNKDSKDLAKAIDYLLSNETERLRRGKLGRTICEKEYADTIYNELMAKLYKQVYMMPNKNKYKIEAFNDKIVQDVYSNLIEYTKGNDCKKIPLKTLEQLNPEDLLEINKRLFVNNIKTKEATASVSLIDRTKNFLRRFKLLVKLYHKIIKD